MEFQISKLDSQDFEEVVRLVNSAYRGDESRQGWTTEADFLEGQRTDIESLSSSLRSSLDRVVLALRQGADKPILGCVFLERFQDAKGIGCYLGMLTVSPKMQNLGIGKVLLDEAEGFARSWGATRVILNVVHLRESLMAWYERRGYRKTGGTKPFPYGDSHAGVPVRDDLYFIVFERAL